MADNNEQRHGAPPAEATAQGGADTPLDGAELEAVAGGGLGDLWEYCKEKVNEFGQSLMDLKNGGPQG